MTSDGPFSPGLLMKEQVTESKALSTRMPKKGFTEKHQALHSIKEFATAQQIH